ADFTAHCTVSSLRSRQILFRFFDALNEIIEEGGRMRAVEYSVIAGQRDSHHRADARFAVHGYNSIANAAYGENGRLRRVDDGSERVHMVHAQIAEGESCSCDIAGTQPSRLRAPGEFGLPGG